MQAVSEALSDAVNTAFPINESDYPLGVRNSRLFISILLREGEVDCHLSGNSFVWKEYLGQAGLAAQLAVNYLASSDSPRIRRGNTEGVAEHVNAVLNSANTDGEQNHLSTLINALPVSVRDEMRAVLDEVGSFAKDSPNISRRAELVKKRAVLSGVAPDEVFLKHVQNPDPSEIVITDEVKALKAETFYRGLHINQADLEGVEWDDDGTAIGLKVEDGDAILGKLNVQTGLRANPDLGRESNSQIYLSTSPIQSATYAGFKDESYTSMHGQEVTMTGIVLECRLVQDFGLIEHDGGSGRTFSPLRFHNALPSYVSSNKAAVAYDVYDRGASDVPEDYQPYYRGSTNLIVPHDGKMIEIVAVHKPTEICDRYIDQKFGTTLADDRKFDRKLASAVEVATPSHADDTPTPSPKPKPMKLG